MRVIRAQAEAAIESILLT